MGADTTTTVTGESFMSDSAPKVRIALNGEFSAGELEAVIRRLAETRAAMTPPVPMAPPIGLDEEVLLQDSAAWDIRRLVTGGLRFWVRDDGVGWLAFTVAPQALETLRQLLSEEPSDTFRAH